MAKKLKKRKILNEIREVSVYDFADDPRRKKHPKMQNIKLFSINQNLTKILIYLKNFKEFNIILQNLRLI